MGSGQSARTGQIDKQVGKCMLSAYIGIKRIAIVATDCDQGPPTLWLSNQLFRVMTMVIIITIIIIVL